MFYSMMHSTHFIYGYMVEDHSDSERGNLMLPHGLLFPINSHGSFICTTPQTDNTYHGLCYISCGSLVAFKGVRFSPVVEHLLMVQQVVGSVPRDGPIELLFVAVSTPMTGITKVVVCPVCGMVYIKELLLLIEKKNSCSGSIKFFLSSPLPYLIQYNH